MKISKFKLFLTGLLILTASATFNSCHHVELKREKVRSRIENQFDNSNLTMDNFLTPVEENSVKTH